MTAVFILSLIPLLQLSLYSHPAGDDYAYGLLAHLAWENSHSLSEVLKAAVENVRNYYNTWQGTYASIFLMSLQPAVLSQRLYPLTTVLMLGMLIFSTFFLFRVLFTRYLKLPRSIWLMLALSVLFLCIQVPEEGKSAFFWFNGAVHYVFMHSCMLLLLSCLLLFLKAETKLPRTLYLIAACFLGFVTGGSNYVTALLTPILLALILLLSLIVPALHERPSAPGQLLLRLRRNLPGLLPLAAAVIGLFINVAAPGNSVRMAAQTAPLDAPDAIYYSFVYAIDGIRNWTGIYLLFFAVLTFPFLFEALSRTDFDFPLPGCAAALSFCVIAASYTPSLYSMGHVYIFGRTLNIMRMLYYLLFFLNLVYVTGWLSARCRESGSMPAVLHFSGWLKQKRRRSFAAGMTVFFLGILIFSDKNEITSLSAVDSLSRGDAQSYHEESLYRISLLTMEGVDEVWVPNFSVCPPLLDPQELSTDPSDYRNEAVASWFGISTLHMSEVY